MSEIVKAMSFEDRLKLRIKDSIGELMTDDDLSKIVHRSMEEVFFGDRYEKTPGYGPDKKLPPLINVLVKDALDDKVRNEITSYINSHSEEVQKIIAEVVNNGIGLAAIKAVSSIFRQDIDTLEYNIQNKLRDGLI